MELYGSEEEDSSDCETHRLSADALTAGLSLNMKKNTENHQIWV